LAEGAAIQIADRRDIFRLLLSDLDHTGSPSAERRRFSRGGLAARQTDCRRDGAAFVTRLPR
jgi:hypothetical protein